MSSGEKGAKVGDGITWSLKGFEPLDGYLAYVDEFLGALA